MIFQTFQTIEDINGTGITGVFQTAAAAFDAFPIKLPELILGALFIILAFASYFSTQRRYGRGDLPASFIVAGFVCVVVGFMMSLIPNFINQRTLVIVVILEIGFAFWFFQSKE